MTLHVDPNHEVQPVGTCTFSPPADQQLGMSNEGNTDCGSDVGCSVIGNSGGYGTSFNNGGGGVYALEVSPRLQLLLLFLGFEAYSNSGPAIRSTFISSPETLYQ